MNYSAPFWTCIFFDFIVGKFQSPSFLWFLDLADMTMTPKTNIVYLWRHKATPNNPRTSKVILNILERCDPHNLSMWKLKNV